MPIEIGIVGRSFIRGWVRGYSIILAAYVGVLGYLGIKADVTKIQNSQKYAKEIDEYKEKIKEYSKKFDIHTQSDMEIIMRVMKDMHETIQGYGEPE